MTTELVERGGRLIVSAPFNPAWREWARDHGGKWDAGSKAWTFRPLQRYAVEAALRSICTLVTASPPAHSTDARLGCSSQICR